jgi:hypothetical protein
MSISYNKNTYNSIVAAKIENEDAIRDIYANFGNFTQDDKYAALEVVDSLQIINEEFNKYIAVYNSITQNENRVNEYIVSMGDTILSIAQKETGDYNNWKELMRFNKLSDIDIEIGTVILIPQNL